jgi:hypothetical protein
MAAFATRNASDGTATVMLNWAKRVLGKPAKIIRHEPGYWRDVVKTTAAHRRKYGFFSDGFIEETARLAGEQATTDAAINAICEAFYRHEEDQYLCLSAPIEYGLEMPFERRPSWVRDLIPNSAGHFA